MGRAIRSKDIKELRSLLGGTNAKVVAPDDDGYKEAIDRWSKAAVKLAGVAILPTNASQISKVFKYASQENIDLAVRGGGHSTSGSSSTDGGLLIDLRSIRHANTGRAIHSSVSQR
jgi:FAD/FMN-containing dehydrogenase